MFNFTSSPLSVKKISRASNIFSFLLCMNTKTLEVSETFPGTVASRWLKSKANSILLKPWLRDRWGVFRIWQPKSMGLCCCSYTDSLCDRSSISNNNCRGWCQCETTDNGSGRTYYHSVLVFLLNHHRENISQSSITDKCHRWWRKYLKIQWFQLKWLMNYTFN